MSGQINTEVYTLAARIDLMEAAKVKTLADREGLTLSRWVVRLVEKAVRGVKASAENLEWMVQRRAANIHARAIADERTIAGRYRKPPAVKQGMSSQILKDSHYSTRFVK